MATHYEATRNFDMGCGTSLPVDDAHRRRNHDNDDNAQATSSRSYPTATSETPAERRQRLHNEHPPPHTCHSLTHLGAFCSRSVDLERLSPAPAAASPGSEDRPTSVARRAGPFGSITNAGSHDAAAERSRDLASMESSVDAIGMPRTERQASVGKSATLNRAAALNPLPPTTLNGGSLGHLGQQASFGSMQRDPPYHASRSRSSPFASLLHPPKSHQASATIDIRQASSGRSFMLASAGAFGHGSLNPIGGDDRHRDSGETTRS